MNQTQDILNSCVARAELAFSHASNKAAARDAALYLAHTAEGEGIRPLVARGCDFLVRLPMRGRVQSLNAGAALAAIAYEVVRQQTRA